jgi:hypothetical protein
MGTAHNSPQRDGKYEVDGSQRLEYSFIVTSFVSIGRPAEKKVAAAVGSTMNEHEEVKGTIKH